MDRWTHFKEDILLSFYGIDAINLEVGFLNIAFVNKESGDYLSLNCCPSVHRRRKRAFSSQKRVDRQAKSSCHGVSILPL